MKVLVTGGTGYVGSHSVAALLDAGHEVRMFVRSPDRVGEALGPLEASVDDITAGDVTDEVTTRAAIAGCEAVLHAANMFSFQPRYADTMRRVNTAGTENVLQLSLEAGLDPIIHVSTVGTLLGDEPEITDETDIGRACGPYTESKIAAEKIARRFQGDGAPVVITYPAVVLGPHDPYLGESGRLAVSILKGQMRMVNDGDFAISDVRDVAAAHGAIIEPGKGPRRFLLAGQNVTLRGIIDIIGDLTGRNLAAMRVPDAMAIGTGRVGDFLNRRFGIRPPYGVEGPSLVRAGRPVRARRALDELGITFRPAEDSIRDTLVWLLAQGHITPKQAGALATTSAG